MPDYGPSVDPVFGAPSITSGSGPSDAARADANPTSPSNGGTSYRSNPPFDYRLGGSGGVDSEGNFVRGRNAIERGYIMTDAGNVTGHQYIINFQFNPTSFVHTSRLSSTLPVQQSAAGGDTTATPGATSQGANFMNFAASTGQSISFNLLFDRTYETWHPKTGDVVANSGVLVDIKALYSMLGMYDGFGGDSGGSIDPTAIHQLTTAPMRTVPVWVQFGPLMSYYGLIGGLTVTFTHFTQKMIPVRAAVNLNMQIIPKLDPVNRDPGVVSQSTPTIDNPTILRRRAQFSGGTG